MNGKTKRVNGVDLSSSAFAWVGNEQNTATWLLPLWIPGDAQKTVNAVKTSLYRFDTANIPDSERERVWFTLYGALLAHGIKTDRRTFAAKNEATQPAEPSTPTAPVKPPKTRAKEILSQKEVKEITALADIKADLFLRQLGLD